MAKSDNRKPQLLLHQHYNPRNHVNILIHMEKDFRDDYIKDLEMGYYPALIISAQYNYKGPHMWKRKAESIESVRDLKMLHWWLWRWTKMPQAKEFRQRLEAGKGNKTDFHLQSPEGTQPHQCLDFSLVKPILDFWPLKR